MREYILTNFNDISIPSYRPSDVNSEAGKDDFLFDKLLGKIEKVAPAQIISYDRNQNRAKVQILAQTITSNGGKLNRQALDNIPVLQLCGGDILMSFPVKTGDIGWLVACDRDITVFKQLLKTFAPSTYQKHKYKDSFFIPDSIKGYSFSADDTNSLVITSIDGNTKLALSNSGIKIKGNVTVDGEVTANNINLSTHTHGGVQSGGSNTGVPQ